MRPALIALAAACLAAAAPARAGAPLALAERQVVTLEFDRPVAHLAVTDPDLLAIQTRGARVRVTAARGGRASLQITFDDGAIVAYDVTVAAARGAAVAAAGPTELVLAVGEERRLRAPGLARVLVEENGVARVRAEGEQVVVVGATPGTASVVLVDGSGTRTTWPVRVR